MNKYAAAFEPLLELVQKGWSISGALRKLGLCRWDFYNHCPKELLTELQHLRAARSLKPATSRDCPEFSEVSKLSKAAMLNPFGEAWEDEQ